MPQDAEKVIEQIARRIGELRERAGLTQVEVAERLDTGVSNYQRIEHGLQNLTIRTMVRIASTLGVPVEAFFEAPKARGTKRGRGRRPA